MDLPPPSPHDSQERLYEQARLYFEKYEEKRRALEKVKAYVALWKNDKRMRIAGEILLREIDRLEREA